MSGLGDVLVGLALCPVGQGLDAPLSQEDRTPAGEVGGAKLGKHRGPGERVAAEGEEDVAVDAPRSLVEPDRVVAVVRMALVAFRLLPTMRVWAVFVMASPWQVASRE